MENLENSAMSKDGDVVLAMHHNHGNPINYSAGFDDDSNKFFGVTEPKKAQVKQKESTSDKPAEKEESPEEEPLDNSFQPMLF